jgi:hypothetical protein
MTKKEILQAAEENAMAYCMHRGMAKAAFIEGALWAMQRSREIIEKAKNDLDADYHETEM